MAAQRTPYRFDMPYHNVNAHTLYQSCISASWDWQNKDDSLSKALAWVEAENTVMIWKLFQAWFEMMESGIADDQYPDIFWKDDDYPFLKPLTQDIADELIAEIDADCMLEQSRFRQRSAPAFDRLVPPARMASSPAVYRVTGSGEGIARKAGELVQ